MLADCNIPFEKSDLMLPFLRRHILLAELLPCANTLRSYYLHSLYAPHKQKIIEQLKDKYISICIVETTDAESRSVINVMIIQNEKSYLAETKYASNNVNNEEIARVFNDVREEYKISYDKVIAFISDGASYNKLAFQGLVSSLYPKLIHVKCLAHELNLIAEKIIHNGELDRVRLVVQFVKDFFTYSPARRRRYGSVPLFGVANRWGSWYDAAESLHEHFLAFRSFCYSDPEAMDMLSKYFIPVESSSLYQMMGHIVDETKNLRILQADLESKGVALAATIVNRLALL